MRADFTEALIETNPVTVRRRVLWGECDPAGVVYTPRFADYAISGRDWFTRIGLGFADRPHPSRHGIAYPMRAMDFEFKSFLAADNVFDMAMRVIGVSERTFSIEIRANNVENEKEAFLARLTSVCVDGGLKCSIPLPDDVRTALESYLAAQPAVMPKPR